MSLSSTPDLYALADLTNQVAHVILPCFMIACLLCGAPRTTSVRLRIWMWIALAGIMINQVVLRRVHPSQPIMKIAMQLFSLFMTLSPMVVLMGWTRSLRPANILKRHEHGIQWSLLLWIAFVLLLAIITSVIRMMNSNFFSSSTVFVAYITIIDIPFVILHSILAFFAISVTRQLISARRLAITYHTAHGTLPPPLEPRRIVKGGLLATLVAVGFAAAVFFCTQNNLQPIWISETAWSILLRLGLTFLGLFSFILAIHAFRFGYERMP